MSESILIDENGVVNEKFLKDVTDQFIIGKTTGVKRLGEGNINSTYEVQCENGEKFVLQRINKNVFKKPDEVMENIKGVTRFLKKSILREGGDAERRTLFPVDTLDGNAYYVDDSGEYWRMYNKIKGAKTYTKLDDSEIKDPVKMFGKVGEAFGDFQKRLGDYPADTLNHTIPDFHNTPKRFSDLEIAIEADKVGRLKQISRVIEYLKSCEEECKFIEVGKRKGDFLLRVTHNDPKLDNVMIDKETEEAICVIDLDTVMPDSVLADFGDAIRSGTNKAGERAENLEDVEMDLELFESFTRGFLEKAGDALKKEEIQALYKAPRVLTLELAMRFTSDYLNGDEYFRINDGDPKTLNIDKASVQIKLAQDMKEKEEKMKQIVDNIAKDLGLLGDEETGNQEARGIGIED